MARISGLKERQEALTQIESKIKSLKPLNIFLATANDSNEYTVSFNQANSAHKIKASVYCEDKNVINDLVLAYKKKIAAEIEALAKEYSITLDETDKKIMEELFVPNKKIEVAEEQ